MLYRAILLIVAATLHCGPVLAEDNSSALPVNPQSHSLAESLFKDGLNATAMISGGKIRVPADRFPCASCHGSNGLGRSEGGTRIPPITGSYLTVDTSRRGAYTMDTFLDAIRTGVNPQGQMLSQIMPRYEADETILRSLFEYLHMLDRMQRSGITPTTIAFKAPLDEQTRLGFLAAMEDFNRQGGSYGRTMISVTKSEDYLVSADAVFERLDKEVVNVLQSRLLTQAKNDGVIYIDVSSQQSARTLNHLLEPYGLSYNSSAPVLYIGAAGSGPHTSDTNAAVRKAEQTTQRVEFSEDTDSADLQSPETQRNQRIYAVVWSTDSAPGDWLNVASDLVIAGFDEQAIQWSLAQGVSAGATRGYALARLMFDAVLIAARDVTQAELLETIEAIDLESRVVVVRSEH